MTTPTSALQSLQLKARIRKAIEALPDPAHQLEFTTALNDPALQDHLQDLLDAIEQHSSSSTASASEPTARFESRFETRAEAVQYMNEQLFPFITDNVRLFKQLKRDGDEFLIVNQDWFPESDTYMKYGRETAVENMLVAYGLPSVIFYKSVDPETKKITNGKIEVLREWQRAANVQQLKLTAFDYVPGKPNIVGHKWNTFRDMSVPAMPGIDVSPFLDHLRNNICNGVQEQYDYMIRWLAHLVQKPGQQPMTAIAIINKREGTGKGIMLGVIKRMLGGDRNVNVSLDQADCDRFNSALACKLLLVFNEASFSGDVRQSNVIKKLISDDTIRLEPKGVDAYEVGNYARILITSNNEETAVPATIGTRRWLIVECRADLQDTYLAKLANQVGENAHKGNHPDEIPNFINGLKHYLETFDISDFVPHLHLPQQTTGMAAKIRNSYKTDSPFAFLAEWLTSKDLTLSMIKSGSKSISNSNDGHTETSTRQEDHDVTIDWNSPCIPLSEVYGVYAQLCKAAFGIPVANTYFGRSLEVYGFKTERIGAGGKTHLILPHPAEVLDHMRKKSRFDNIVTPEQEKFLRNGFDDKRFKDSSKISSKIAKMLNVANAEP